MITYENTNTGQRVEVAEPSARFDALPQWHRVDEPEPVSATEEPSDTGPDPVMATPADEEPAEAAPVDDAPAAKPKRKRGKA